MNLAFPRTQWTEALLGVIISAMIEVMRDFNNPPTNRTGLYPFDDMEVGDAFLIDACKRSSAMVAALAWAKRRGLTRKFKSAYQTDGSVRVWRVL